MYNYYLNEFYRTLPLGESFDLLERKVIVGGRTGSLFFIDGLVDGETMQRVMDYLLKVRPEDLSGINESQVFISTHLPFLDTSLVKPSTEGKKPERNFRERKAAKIADCCKQATARLYAGLVPFILEGLDQIMILDARNYPARSVEEPQKEKSLRGAKDGFTEGFMQNIALIRRRLRDNRLIFRNFSIGTLSKTDVAIAYMREKADMNFVKKLEGKLKTLEQKKHIDTLTVGDQSLLERLLDNENTKSGRWSRFLGNLNPFPKVRYSQRPDIISAHIAEGKVAIIVDNSPTVMLVPVGLFDFLQDVDDYYFPQLTGNYFRILRTLNFLVILFLTPVYLLLVESETLTLEALSFFVPQEPYAIPLFWQFILLEIAVDGLKLASLNTPESLGMSLSVIGALILGQFSIDSGWFIPQTILCMAVVALAGFTQPSIELSYSVKFTRIFLLVGVCLFGLTGLAVILIFSIILVANTKTLSQQSYLYPLVPFRWNLLKRLLFRTRM